MAEFGEIVEQTFIMSKAQIDRREFGNSQILYSGTPTVYHAGDVVNLPYESGEISTMEAVGLAWGAFSIRVTPS